MSPGRPRDHQPGLDDALAKLEVEHQRVRDALIQSRRSAAVRADLINNALELGATLRLIATRLGVSPETVRKMAAVQPAKKGSRS